MRGRWSSFGRYRWIQPQSIHKRRALHHWSSTNTPTHKLPQMPQFLWARFVPLARSFRLLATSVYTVCTIRIKSNTETYIIGPNKKFARQSVCKHKTRMFYRYGWCVCVDNLIFRPLCQTHKRRQGTTTTKKPFNSHQLLAAELWNNLKLCNIPPGKSFT